MAGFPVMGGANPQNIPSMLEAGIITPEQAQEMAARAGGGGMQPAAPAGAAPAAQGMQMPQSQFSGYGRPVDPAVEARRNAVYQELIRRQQGR